MTEGGEDLPYCTAIFAEGSDIDQSVTNATVNIVAQNQYKQTIVAHVNAEPAGTQNRQPETQNRRGSATLANADHVEQNFTSSKVNVVAGDLVQYGQPSNSMHQLDRGIIAFETETKVKEMNDATGNIPTKIATSTQSAGCATLGEGEGVKQNFENCNINLVCGDQVQIDQHIHIHPPISGSPKHTRHNSEQMEVPDASSSRIDPLCKAQPLAPPQALVESKSYRMPVNIREKISGRHLKNFVRKIRTHSWKNVQSKVMENYDDLSEPDKEFYPRVKTGFELFKGDYVPQDGFSAHCQPKGGTLMDIGKCMEAIQEDHHKPCIIIGQPGSGKTILMKRFAKTFMIANKLHSQEKAGLWDKLTGIFRKDSKEYDVVFHVNIRDMPNVSDGTLAEVIFHPHVTGLTKKEAKYGLKAILKKKIHVIMFFDGLDQATWEPKCDRKIGPWQKSSTGDIIGNILAGHLLSDVAIVISSREHSVARLPKEMRPHFVAALVGFSDADAKSLYCELMDENAAEDWERMRISNPAMHSMCLTPLFLIFYMITKKRNPEDPPDCATGVMVSIIQIFLECENARNLDDSLLGNLKKMAFLGTKERRVVFTTEDLEHFNLAYNDISDIVIQVPGLSILGHKILQGMFRFFFSHQTLQEILAALHIVGMQRKKFENVVDEEFTKPYWSVVRSFTCGILKNERVRNNISNMILKQDSEDFAKKREHLIKHLQKELGSDQSPAEKLETFVALKEANAMDLLQGLAENLDFSHSTFTPTMINILCSVMKYIGTVPYLSLANSQLNDQLLEVLSKEANGLSIKVGKFNVRGNGACQNVNAWGRVLKSLRVSCFITDVPSNEQHLKECDGLIKIVDAADGNVDQILIDQTNVLQLSMRTLRQLANYKVRIKIRQINLTAKKEEIDIWHQVFSLIPFTIGHCFVENPPLYEGRVDFKVWNDAVAAATVDNVKKVTMTMANDSSLTIHDIVLLNGIGIACEMSQLSISLDSTEFDVDIWQQAFQQMTIAINRCFIKPQQIEEAFDVKAWLTAAEAADVDNVKDISLQSRETISLSLDDLLLFNRAKFSGEIHKLRIILDTFPIDDHIFHQAIQQMKLTVHCLLITPPRSLQGVIDVNKWTSMAACIRNVTTKEVSLDSVKELPITIDIIKELNTSGFDHKIAHLWIQPFQETFDPIAWRQCFNDMTFNVEHCFVIPPKLNTGEVETELWIDAAEVTNCKNVESVCLKTLTEITLKISDLISLSHSHIPCQINHLRIKAGITSFVPASWREAFSQRMLSVKHCLLEPPRITNGKVDTDIWTKSAHIITSSGKVTELFLSSTNDQALDLNDLRKLGQSALDFKISELWIKQHKRIPNTQDAWRDVFINVPFTVGHCYVNPPQSNNEAVNINEWINKGRIVAANCKCTVTLKSTEKIVVTMFDIWSLSSCGLPAEISSLCVLCDEGVSAKYWRDVFQKMKFTVERCYVKPPTSDKGEVKVNEWIEKASAANVANVGSVTLISTEGISLKIDDVSMLNSSNLNVEIDELRIKPDPESFDAEVWRRCFQTLKLMIRHCILEPPQPYKGIIDIKLWKSAAESVTSGSVEEMSLCYTEDCPLDFPNLLHLNEWAAGKKIHQLYIKPDTNSFDIVTWREAFKQMTFTIDQCLIGTPQTEKGEIDVTVWMQTAEIAKTRGKRNEPTKVVIYSTKDRPLKIQDVINMNQSHHVPQVTKLWVQPDATTFDEHLWKNTFQCIRFDVIDCFVKCPISVEKNIELKVWIRAARAANVSRVQTVSLEQVKHMDLIEEAELSIDDIICLNNVEACFKITHLVVKEECHAYDRHALRKAFCPTTLMVNRCSVGPLSSAEGYIDVKNWINAAQIVHSGNVDTVTVTTGKGNALGCREITQLWHIDFKMSELWIKPRTAISTLTDWKTAISGIDFTVDKCYVLIADDIYINIEWNLKQESIQIAKYATEIIGNVTLISQGRIPLTIDDISMLNNLETHVEVSQIFIKPCPLEFNEETWRTAFQGIPFTVDSCHVEAPHVTERECDFNVWLKAAKTANVDNVKEVVLTSMNEICVNISDLILLNDSLLPVKICQLCVKLNMDSFDFDVWQRIWQNMKLFVENCIIVPSQTSEERSDFNLLKDICETARSKNVGGMLVHLTEDYAVDINSIRDVQELAMEQKIDELHIKLHPESFNADELRQALERMTFPVGHCLIEWSPLSMGEIDVKLWIDAAKAIATTATNVSLNSTKDSPLCINDVISLCKSEHVPKMSKCWVETDAEAFDATIWRETFQQISFDVGTCIVKCPVSDQGDVPLDVLLEATRAADVPRVNKILIMPMRSFQFMKKINLDISEIKLLTDLNFHGKIAEIWIAPDLPFDEEIWQQIFHSMTFTADHCIIESPHPTELGTDFEVWLQAAQLVNSDKVHEVSLAPTEKVVWKAHDIELLSNSNFHCQITNLWIEPNTRELDTATVWQRIFQNMNVTVGHFYVKPSCSDLGRVDVNEWIEKAKSIGVTHAKKVTLKSTDGILVTLDDIQLLIDSNLHVEIHLLRIELGRITFNIDVLQNIDSTKFAFDQCSITPPRSSEGKIDMNLWVSAAKTLEAFTTNSVWLDSTEETALNIDGVMQINNFGIQHKVIHHLWTQPSLQKFDSMIWWNCFGERNFNLDHCFVKPPQSITGEIDVEVWLDAAEAINCTLHGSISLQATEEITLGIGDIDCLAHSGLTCQIKRLRVKPNKQSFLAPEWQQTFQQDVLHVSHCLIEAPLQSKGNIDYLTWRIAAEVISIGNVERVSLCFPKDKALKIYDLSLLCNLSAEFENGDLWIESTGEPHIWREVFATTTFTIGRCFIKCQNGAADAYQWIKYANMVNDANLQSVILKSTERIFLDIHEIAALNDSDLTIEIPQVLVKPDPQTFDEEMWRTTFQKLSFTVDSLYVEAPPVVEGECDFRVWLKAGKAVNVRNVMEISLQSREDVSATIDDIKLLSESSMSGEIHQLLMEPTIESFDADIWQRNFKKMKFTVRNCVIKVPRPLEGKIDIKMLNDVAEAVGVGSVEELSLHSTKDCVFDINSFLQLNELLLYQKIRELYVKPYKNSYDVYTWRLAFQQMTLDIDQCFIESPRRIKGEVDVVTNWMDVAEVAGKAVSGTVSIYSVEECPLSIQDVIRLCHSRHVEKAETLCIKPDSTSFDTETWVDTFQEMSIHIGTCIVKPPSPFMADNDGEVWLMAARAACGPNVKDVLLKPIEPFHLVKKASFSISDIELLIQSNFCGEISEIHAYPGRIHHTRWLLFDPTLWRHTINSLTFTINCCFLEPPIVLHETSKAWIQAAHDIVTDKVKKVSLLSSMEISLTICDITLLMDSNLSGHIPNVLLSGCFSPNWRELGVMSHKFSSSFKFNFDPPDSNDLRYFAEGHGHVKTGRIIISEARLHRLLLLDMKEQSDDTSDNCKELVLDVHHEFLAANPEHVACLVKDATFDQIVIASQYAYFDIATFAIGLVGFQIKKLAIAHVYDIDVIGIISQCHVEQLYLRDNADEETIQSAQKYSKVTILSKLEWGETFL